MSPMNQLRLKSDPTIGKSVEQELSVINVSSLENGANILSDGDFVPGLGVVVRGSLTLLRPFLRSNDLFRPSLKHRPKKDSMLGAKDVDRKCHILGDRSHRYPKIQRKTQCPRPHIRGITSVSICHGP